MLSRAKKIANLGKYGFHESNMEHENDEHEKDGPEFETDQNYFPNDEDYNSTDSETDIVIKKRKVDLAKKTLFNVLSTSDNVLNTNASVENISVHVLEPNLLECMPNGAVIYSNAPLNQRESNAIRLSPENGKEISLIANEEGQLSRERNIELGNIDENPRTVGLNDELEQSQIGLPKNIDKKRARTENEKQDNARSKHPFINDGCNCKTRGCDNLSREERQNIYLQFWNMSKNDQIIYLSNRVIEMSAKRKVEGSKRDYTRQYYFDQNGDRVEVCQKFFLKTLGYTGTSVLQHISKASKDDHGTKLLILQKDQRGKHKPANKIPETPIKDHIRSFNPQPSHYRRSHAPNRKYLPPDLTIKYMYDNFKEQNDMDLSYEKYRQVVDDLNIGFYNLEADKCGFCIEMDMNPTEENLKLKEAHLQQVEKVRHQYRKDGELSDELNLFRVYAADLQKVFLLPRMPKVKDSFFTSRLVVFNETFAAMAKKHEHFCILWHEAIAGRRAEDIASSFLKCLQCNRDAEHIILWLDNCCGQNKNILISAILSYINSSLCTTKSITLKYLISGHTYMAADGLHGKIEQAIRKMGNVEDFSDFRHCCKKASARMNIVEMQYNDFYKLENKLKCINRKKNLDEPQLPYFKDIVAIKFVKGSDILYVKNNYEDGEYSSYNNLLKKIPLYYYNIFKQQDVFRPRKKK